MHRSHASGHHNVGECWRKRVLGELHTNSSVGRCCAIEMSAIGSPWEGEEREWFSTGRKDSTSRFSDAAVLRPTSTTVDRYAAPNVDFVLVVGPHNGLGAQSAPKDTVLTSRGALPGYQGQSPWLVTSRAVAAHGPFTSERFGT